MEALTSVIKKKTMKKRILPSRSGDDGGSMRDSEAGTGASLN